MTQANRQRKAAILLRSLAPAAAATLLAQLAPEEAQQLRDAVRSLGDVAEDERREVAEAVRAGARPRPGEKPSTGVELSVSAAAAAHTAAGPIEPQPPSPASRPPGHDQGGGSADTLGGLTASDADSLAECLDREPPGVVAVVLSRLAPEKAADVLDRLRFDRRADAIERLASLGEGDAESIAVLAKNVTDRVTAHRLEGERQAARYATIRAILESATPQSREELLGRLRRRGCGWLDRLTAADTPPVVEGPMAESRNVARGSLTGGGAGGSRRGVEAAGPTPPAEEPAPAKRANPEPTDPADPAERGATHAGAVTRPVVPFSVVESLPPRLLAEVVRRTPPRVVLLALAGSSDVLQRRIERQVPARQARELRRRIESLGPTTLREVDAAKRVMAAVAADLCPPRHAAAA